MGQVRHAGVALTVVRPEIFPFGSANHVGNPDPPAISGHFVVDRVTPYDPAEIIPLWAGKTRRGGRKGRPFFPLFFLPAKVLLFGLPAKNQPLQDIKIPVGA